MPRDIRKRGRGRIGVSLRVQPSAPGNKLVGWNARGELRLKISGKPAGGAANRELISFLARRFKLKKTDIQLETGSTSRKKVISIPSSVRPQLEKLPDI